MRAADAAGLPTALVQLRLNCRNRLGDDTYAARLREENPHGVNVFHIDPPAAHEIDHHHGAGFRAGRCNIGYFAWELPEFPDAWLPSFDSFDEIWCPSDFTAAAVREKSPIPVLTMPHAIAFEPPAGSPAELRARFGLPRDAFLVLSLFDLNSYAERKNPRAAVEAFRRAALPPPRDGGGAALVLKVQNVAGNEADFAAFHIVTMGQPVSEKAAALFAENRYDDYMKVHGIGVEMAEALAEFWHHRIRSEWGFVDEDGPSLHGLFRQHYRGGRYSWGYPACPDLEDNAKVAELLEAGRIGITLSEETGWQYQPEQTTSAIICHHPRAKYFVAR